MPAAEAADEPFLLTPVEVSDEAEETPEEVTDRGGRPADPASLEEAIKRRVERARQSGMQAEDFEKIEQIKRKL